MHNYEYLNTVAVWIEQLHFMFMYLHSVNTYTKSYYFTLTRIQFICICGMDVDYVVSQSTYSLIHGGFGERNLAVPLVFARLRPGVTTQLSCLAHQQSRLVLVPQMCHCMPTRDVARSLLLSSSKTFQINLNNTNH